MKHTDIKTLAALKQSGYQSKSVKQELRDNLISRLQSGEALFSEIKGYEDTVIPQLQAAILSRHNTIFLGLRGQAKTRLARLMLNLLDEWIPVVKGSEINDDPLQPISRYACDLLDQMGDDTPISWVHRQERFTEKLATPDVSVADLVGDVDPIKAATLKLPYSDERVIHFGLIPRSHRGIFVINELPDLQARIQVSLFNILQEGDIQIRGFKLRMPLDIAFVFTANPEDYTNRGSIVTPLKDRIGSQILTHYPKSIEISKSITLQEAAIHAEQRQRVQVNELLLDLVETIGFEARDSEYVDKKSGVSARLSISALENLYSHAERRLLIIGEKQGRARVSDLYGVLASLTGKIELVYEGELEGMGNVAFTLVGKAIRNRFNKLFPHPERVKKSKHVENPYQQILLWFNEGNELELNALMKEADYRKALKQVEGLENLVKNCLPSISADDKFLMMEFALHGLAEYSQISRQKAEERILFKDLVSSMFNLDDESRESN